MRDERLYLGHIREAIADIRTYAAVGEQEFRHGFIAAAEGDLEGGAAVGGFVEGIGLGGDEGLHGGEVGFGPGNQRIAGKQ